MVNLSAKLNSSWFELIEIRMRYLKSSLVKFKDYMQQPYLIYSKSSWCLIKYFLFLLIRLSDYAFNFFFHFSKEFIC